jgi:hypothetical protein
MPTDVVEKRQKNLYLSTEALELLKTRAQEAGLNESQLVERLILERPMIEDRLTRIEQTFTRLSETNQALAAIWASASGLKVER